MSYAKQAEERRGSQGSALLSKKPRDGDSAYLEDSQRVQEAVQKMQQCAAELRKETSLLRSPHSDTSKGKAKVQESVRQANKIADDATRVLKGLSGSMGGSVEEQNRRRLMQQKLSKDLMESSKAVESAYRTYEAAQAECASKQSAEASSASRVALEEAAPIAPDASDIEKGLQRKQQQQQDMDVTASEAETHAAIVNEYVEDLTRVEQDVRNLQRSMVDLAEHTKIQGEALDTIEASMSEAADSTAGATRELLVTSQTQRRGTKRFMWFIAIAGTLAAVGALFS